MIETSIQSTIYEASDSSSKLTKEMFLSRIIFVIASKPRNLITSSEKNTNEYIIYNRFKNIQTNICLTLITRIKVVDVFFLSEITA